MNPDLISELIHEQTNVVRQSHDLSTLALDLDLEAIARYHSQQMATDGCIFHETPDGETLSDRLDKMEYDAISKGAGQSHCHDCGKDLRQFAGPDYCLFCGSKLTNSNRTLGFSGENLAHMSFTSAKSKFPSEDEVAESIVNGWLNSPGHRENLLDERFEREAIGVVVTKQTRIDIYVTQNFS